MRTGARIFAVLAALCSPRVAMADDPAARGFDADPYRFSAGLDGDFMVETAEAHPAGSWRAGLLLHYARGLVTWRSGDEAFGHVIPGRLSLDLAGSYSLGWLELSAEMPVVLHQSSDLAPLTSLGIGPPLAEPVSSTALGDLRLFGKVPLLRKLDLPFSLAALLDVRLPTGSKEAFAGDGLLAIPGAAASARIGRVRLDLQLGYAIRAPGQFLQLVVHDAFTYGVGAAVDLPRTWKLDSWKAIADLSGQVPRGFASNSARYSAPLDGRIGLRATVWRDLSVEVGVGTGLGTGAFGRETFRVFGGARWERLLADRDGDGVPDERDRCPDVPGLPELQGCPDGDRDGDGVPDSQDRCPDTKGPKELEGCPDTDGDGIPDIDDKCPKEPGPAQNDGCPLGNEPAVEIQTDRLSLKDAINFDTAKDTIRPESSRILKEIATILQSHPELKRIRVEGHTDIVGSQAYNQDLSERRARSVVEALVARGIARERLVSAGYGFDRPVASNATAFGRAKNRRVEFTILEEKAEPAKEPAKK